MGIEPTPPSGLRLHLLAALLGAVVFSVESWVFRAGSWMYGYGGGLETVPVYRALAFDHRNLALWAPFVGGGLPRLAFWGNADPLGPEQFLFTYLPAWLAYGLHRYLQYFIATFFAARVCREQLGQIPAAFLIACVFTAVVYLLWHMARRGACCGRGCWRPPPA